MIQACLVALGIGWNMTYLGGSCLATTNAPARHAPSIQAVNDASTGIFAPLGAFLPGAVITLVGWGGANLIVIALIAPVLIAALVVGRGRPGPVPPRAQPAGRMKFSPLLPAAEFRETAGPACRLATFSPG